MFPRCIPLHSLLPWISRYEGGGAGSPTPAPYWDKLVSDRLVATGIVANVVEVENKVCLLVLQHLLQWYSLWDRGVTWRGEIVHFRVCFFVRSMDLASHTTIVTCTANLETRPFSHNLTQGSIWTWHDGARPWFCYIEVVKSMIARRVVDAYSLLVAALSRWAQVSCFKKFHSPSVIQCWFLKT